MASLYPAWTVINKLKPAPTEGERAFLSFLESNLNDEYEIFFQPYLNGDLPDIVLLRKSGGALIVEVKDWDLNNYWVDERKRWHVSSNGAVVKSPVDQVLQYKKNLYDLHIDNLLELQLRDYKYWYVVSCAVYFHKADQDDLYRFMVDPVEEGDWRERYETFLKKNITLFGRDSLNEPFLRSVLHETWIERQLRNPNAKYRSKYFTDNLYTSFHRRLKPSWHSLENTRTYSFDKDQSRLVESKPGDQKVKGIAGSGKTLVLAHRAVNAHVRMEEAVLILTFNISLKNYIHDRISAVRQEFGWDNFRIVNYHDFIGSTMNNVGIPFSIPDGFDSWSGEARDQYFEETYYSNLNLFDGKEDKLQKYGAVFIDEFQDYREEWARLIKKYFLADGGEFVIFADYGQDIYGRGDGSLEVTPVLGRWNELKKPHRYQNPGLKALNVLYKQAFFADRYEPTSADAELTLFNTADPHESVAYYWIDALDLDVVTREIISRIDHFDAHPNDVCVMSMSVETLREIDHRYRAATRERTKTMCETVEFYEKVQSDCKGEVARWGKGKQPETAAKRCVRKKLKAIRKNKKWQFWMNSGTVKLSTIHSLKGWEAHTLFFIVEEDMIEESLAELIYAGFTRCTNNLVIFNIGNRDFDAFIRSATELVGVEFREVESFETQ